MKHKVNLKKHRLKVCQTCKAHRNKPSRCNTKKEHVGRKDEACSDYSWNGRWAYELVESCEDCKGSCSCYKKKEEPKGGKSE